MKWIRENIKNVILVYLNILFIVNLLEGAYGIYDMDITYILILITVGTAAYAAFYGVFVLAGRSKGTFLILLLFTLGLAIVYRGYINRFISSDVVESINEINNMIILGKGVTFKFFKGIFMLTIPAVAILSLSLAQRGRLDVLIIMVLSVMMFLWLLEYTNIVKRNLFLFSVLAITTYGVNNHNIFMKKLESKRVKHNYRPIRVGFPIFIVACILAYTVQLIPYKPEGSYVEEIVDSFNRVILQEDSTGNNKEEDVNNIKKNTFRLSRSGYSDSEQKLGGPVAIDDTLVIKVESPDSYYLKGSTKEIYTGISWSSIDSSYVEKNEFQNYAIRRIRGSDEVPKSLTIYPQDKSHSTLFIPNYPSRIISSNTGLYINDINSTASFRAASNDSYSIEFYEEEPRFNRVKAYEGPSFLISNIYENRTEYLELPDSITMRTIELVESIIKGSKNNYEKAQRLVSYISQNYSYSLNTNEVPDNREFVDYYLFEEKEGYCVYSATALAVMLRIAGIPSRYVEGFKMPSSSSNGYYEVTNADAHAWVEAYLEDGERFYWITLDASTTPRLAGIIDRNDEDDTPANNQESPTQNPGNSDTPDVPEEEGKNPNEQENSENGTNTKQKDLVYRIALIVALVATTAIAGKLLFNRLRYRRIIRSQGFIPLYSYFIRRLKALGYVGSAWETDRDMANRIKGKALRDNMNKLVDLVYKEKFGGIIEKVDKRQLYKELEITIKNSSSKKWIYYLRKFIFI